MPETQSSRNRRRDIVILVLAVIATVVVYNLVSSLIDRDRTPSLETATPLSLQDVVQTANGFMDQGMFDRAVVHYQQALALDSLQPDIMVDLGACYHALGENDKAALQFQRALTISPGHSVALFNMGVVSLTAGDTASARDWWMKYLDVATDSQQIQAVREQLSKM